MNDIKDGVVERPFNSIIQLILTAVVGWAGLTIQATERAVLTMNGDVRVITQRINNIEGAAQQAVIGLSNLQVLEQRITHLEKQTDDRYRGEDAKRDFARVDGLVHRLEDRTKRVERLIDDLEKRVDAIGRGNRNESN